MEIVQRYDVVQVLSPEEQAAEDRANTMKVECERIGLAVPPGKSHAFTAGWHEHVFRRPARADAPRPTIDAISLALVDPIGLWSSGARTDASDDETQASTEDQRTRGLAALASRCTTPRHGGRTSRSSAPSPSGAARTPAAETVHTAPSTLGGNAGSGAGQLGGAEGMETDDEEAKKTQAAADTMFARAKEAWKTPSKRDRRRGAVG